MLSSSSFAISMPEDQCFNAPSLHLSRQSSGANSQSPVNLMSRPVRYQPVAHPGSDGLVQPESADLVQLMF
ncbi:hypothetical protein RRG08_034663 [Elysia crispata]|uniref:Uncharacterized protein n=1 Tax=Elysia crispata TaxID=231223 RepID=A0AAE0Z187_9GAST|nr:hypothetical protein RRG08_034663 [Elysia crispata]